MNEIKNLSHRITKKLYPLKPSAALHFLGAFFAARRKKPGFAGLRPRRCAPWLPGNLRLPHPSNPLRGNAYL
jgi:hypothetical protein